MLTMHDLHQNGKGLVWPEHWLDTDPKFVWSWDLNSSKCEWHHHTEQQLSDGMKPGPAHQLINDLSSVAATEVAGWRHACQWMSSTCRSLPFIACKATKKMQLTTLDTHPHSDHMPTLLHIATLHRLVPGVKRTSFPFCVDCIQWNYLSLHCI